MDQVAGGNAWFRYLGVEEVADGAGRIPVGLAIAEAQPEIHGSVVWHLGTEVTDGGDGNAID